MSGFAVVTRFILCGIGGLWLSALCGIMIVMRLVEDDMEHTVHPLLASIGLFAGGLLMLAGVGKWRQWLFLVPFTTWPFVFATVMFGFDRLSPHSGKNIAGAVMGIVMSFIPLWPISARYARQQESGSRSD